MTLFEQRRVGKLLQRADVLSRELSVFRQCQPRLAAGQVGCWAVGTPRETLSQSTDLFFQPTNGSRHLQFAKLCSRAIEVCALGGGYTAVTVAVLHSSALTLLGICQ